MTVPPNGLSDNGYRATIVPPLSLALSSVLAAQAAVAAVPDVFTEDNFSAAGTALSDAFSDLQSAITAISDPDNPHPDG